LEREVKSGGNTEYGDHEKNKLFFIRAGGKKRKKGEKRKAWIKSRRTASEKREGSNAFPLFIPEKERQKIFFSQLNLKHRGTGAMSPGCWVAQMTQSRIRQ